MQYIYTYHTHLYIYTVLTDSSNGSSMTDGFRLRCVNISCLPQTRHEHRHDGQRGAAPLVQISCACKSQDHILQRGRFSTVVCSSRVSNTSKVGILRIYICIYIYIYVFTYIYINMSFKVEQSFKRILAAFVSLRLRRGSPRCERHRLAFVLSRP